MKQYSPYDNIRKTTYPNLYMQAGLHDPRVGYWEPLKFVAKIRDHHIDSADRSTTHVIRLDTKKGHFGGSDRYLRLKELAEEYTFVMTR